jgi:hypothetical protein
VTTITAPGNDAEMVLSKIKRRVSSSKVLFQQNFDAASDESVFVAHYKAVIAAALFLWCAIIMAGPVRSDYCVAESLLNRGLTTTGAIEKVDVKSQPRGRGSKEYITTVDYRFVSPDGQVYRGSSNYKGDEPQRVATGDSIEIVHDPHAPSISGWRTALQGTKAEVYGVFFAAILVVPCCILWLYRYARWKQYRRSLPT